MVSYKSFVFFASLLSGGFSYQTSFDQFPSPSLQSVGVRPAEYEPGLAALTLRVGGRGGASVGVPVRGEVRVVHGTEEVHGAVKAAVHQCFGEEGGVEEQGPQLGYWAFRVDNTLAVEKERNNFLLALFNHLTSQSWDVISSANLTPALASDQVAELFTWLVKKNVNTAPSSECCLLVVGEKQVEVVALAGDNLVAVNNTVRNVIDSMEEKSSNKCKTSESGYISEEEKKDSKASSIEKIDEVIATAAEDQGVVISLRVESPQSPDMLTEIDQEIRKSMENLLQNDDTPLKPESLVESTESDDKSKSDKETETKETKDEIKPRETSSPIKSMDGSPKRSISSSPKKSLEVQKSKSLLTNLFGGRPLSPNLAKLSPDDPSCPSLLPLAPNLVADCHLLVKLLHQLFCRQWKTSTSVRTEEGSSLIFLRHDPRILPGLGQQSLAGLAVNDAGTIHLHNASKEIVESVKLFADAKSLGENSCEFSLKDDAPMAKGRDLLTEIMSVFNNYNFNIYSSLELRLGGQHTNLLLFKPSNVQASGILGLSLGHGNLLTLDGGDQEDIDAVRETLSSRWPYPIVSDMAMSTSCWSWKVKRYPWRMSYGLKLVDRAVDRASKMVRQISFPPPSHNDLESAKSLVVFLMKELSERGWKFTVSHNLNNSNCLLHFSR